MEREDRKKIDILCNHLLQEINMDILWPKLLENRVYNKDDVNIPNWEKNLKNIDTINEVCSTIKTRGPHAFKNLLLSLRQSGHRHIADKLENYDGSNNNKKLNNNGNSEEVNSVSPISIPHPFINEANFGNENKDDYHTKLVQDFEKLQIKVTKAEVFQDGPETVNIDRYIMRSNPRGLVLIITNIIYDVVDSRFSAKHDLDNLQQLFDQMGFKVITETNLTGKQIKEKVKEFSKLKELRYVDSAFVIISSHGYGEHGKQKTEIQGTDYKMSTYEEVFCVDIIDYFTTEQCPFLSGKPKIFIFQTCRGNKHQKAIPDPRLTASTISVPFQETEQPYKLSSRNYEDTLVAYATLPGHVSYRDTYNGSWFIQILCEVFMNYAATQHVYDLLIMTDRRLQTIRASNNRCQTVWIVNQGFNKHCYINPGLFIKEAAN